MQLIKATDHNSFSFKVYICDHSSVILPMYTHTHVYTLPTVFLAVAKLCITYMALHTCIESVVSMAFPARHTVRVVSPFLSNNMLAVIGDIINCFNLSHQCIYLLIIIVNIKHYSVPHT